jgi:hypothetical protein
MAITFDDYINALLSGTYKRKIKIDLLRPDETVREEITALIANTNGSLSVKRNNGSRRSVNFDIINLDNTYIPNENNFYIRQKFRLNLGLEINNEDFFLPQGVFVLDDPSVSSAFSSSLISINGVDKFSLIDGSLGGEIGYVYIININTDISQAIKSVLELVGDTKPPLIDISLIGKTTPYTMTYQPNDTLGQILIDLAQLYSCSCFYNQDGQLEVVKDIDDNLKSSLWDFSPDQFVYQGATNQFRWSDLYTSVRVVGSNVNGVDVSHTATNNNLLSPTSVQNLEFDRIFYYQSDTLSTTQQCIDLSEYILKRKTAAQNSFQINSLAMYHLNVDEIVSLTDPKLGLNNERILINNFDLQLNNAGTLSINAVKSKEIPFI